MAALELAARIRAVALFDPNNDADEDGSPASAAETLARQLELPLLINDEPWTAFRQTLRQLTLFDVGAMVRGTQNLQPLRVVESWPLFNWPAEFVQLRYSIPTTTRKKMARRHPLPKRSLANLNFPC